MATRSKPNWKVLDTLLPMLEKDGWTLPMIASDWGISLATLEGHLTQGVSIVKKTDVDWARFDELKAQGLPMIRISEAMSIPRTTLGPLAKQREKAHQSTPKEYRDTPEEHPSTPEEPELPAVHSGTPEHRSTPEPTELLPDEQYTQVHHDTLPDADPTEVHPGTLEGHQEVMEDVYESVPDIPHISTDEVHQSIPEHPSTPEVHPEVSQGHSSMAHSGVPARQDHLISTPMVHPGIPTEEDWELWTTIKAMWPRVEKMLSDQQVLLGTPLGTPRQTQKKTYVFDVEHIALIDEYARVHRLELKDIIYIMCQEFFERRANS